MVKKLWWDANDWPNISLIVCNQNQKINYFLSLFPTYVLKSVRQKLDIDFDLICKYSQINEYISVNYKLEIKIFSEIQNRTIMLGLNRIAAILETIFRELGTFNNSIFKRYHLFFVDNYIVYYYSIENYKSRTEPSTQRKLHYHLNILIVVSYLIKYVLLTLFEDEWLDYYIDEIYFLYFPYYKRIYVYIICFVIFIIMLKLAIYYYERNLSVNWSKLDSNESGDRLLKHNQDTLLIMANLIYWIGKIVPLVGLWFLSIAYIFLNFLAYLYPDYDFSLIVQCRTEVMKYRSYEMTKVMN